MCARWVDRLLAVFLLIVFIPILVVVGVLILLVDGPPVFFRQVRVGRYGKPFLLWKFRTMRTGVVGGSSVTARQDVRITRVGRFLRRWKLDELPQLWNIVRGEMVFVGPRPEVPEYVALFPVEFSRLLRYSPPGLVDPATLQFLDEEGVLAEEVRRGLSVHEAYVARVLPRKLAVALEHIDLYCSWRRWLFLIRAVVYLVFRRGGGQ